MHAASLRPVSTSPMGISAETRPSEVAVRQASMTETTLAVSTPAQPEEIQVDASPVTYSGSMPLPPPPPQAERFTLSRFFSFAGPGPEAVNGRAAMLGIVTAFLVENASGESVVQQIIRHPSASVEFLAIVALVTLGSMVPAYKNLDAQVQADGSLFRPQSEVINGRAAMLGFAALLATEFITGSAVF